MACCLFGAKPLSEPMLYHFQLDPCEQNFSQIVFENQTFSFKKMHLKMSAGNICLGLNVLNRVCPIKYVYALIVIYFLSD